MTVVMMAGFVPMTATDTDATPCSKTHTHVPARNTHKKYPQESADISSFPPIVHCLLCWAIPGGTAIPGRPVARAEQAPGISPMSKNQFNIVVARKPRIRY